MSFAEEYKKAQEKGKVDQATTQIFQFAAEGEELIGKVKDITPFTHGKFDTEVNQYILDTDLGRVSTVLGAATDKQLAGQIKPGNMVRIVWRGKKPLEGGRTVNVFDVEVFG